MAKILIGCETSGVVREAFAALGHNVWSCDILPADTPTNRHIQDDIRNVLTMDNWDFLAVMHPPCTRLCNSGVRWLKEYDTPPNKTHAEMMQELDEGAALFSDVLHADIPYKCVENPVMHYLARERIRPYPSGFYKTLTKKEEVLRKEDKRTGKVTYHTIPKGFAKFSQSVQPWHFADSDDSEDNQRKTTLLWLTDNLPPLVKTGTVNGETARQDVHNAPPSEDRGKIRSKFFHGIAAAMAAQWSEVLNADPNCEPVEQLELFAA